MLEPVEGTQGRNGVVSNVVEVFGLTFKGLPVPTALPKLHLEGTGLEMSQAVGAHTCQANSEICGGNLVVYRGTGIVATLSINWNLQSSPRPRVKLSKFMMPAVRISMSSSNKEQFVRRKVLSWEMTWSVS